MLDQGLDMPFTTSNQETSRGIFLARDQLDISLEVMEADLLLLLLLLSSLREDNYLIMKPFLVS